MNDMERSGMDGWKGMKGSEADERMIELRHD